MNGNRSLTSGSDTYVGEISALTKAPTLEFSLGAAQAFFHASTLYIAVYRGVRYPEDRPSVMAETQQRLRNVAIKFQDMDKSGADEGSFQYEYDRLSEEISGAASTPVKHIATICYHLSLGHLRRETSDRTRL